MLLHAQLQWKMYPKMKKFGVQKQKSSEASYFL